MTAALIGAALRDVAVLAMWLALPMLIAVAIAGAVTGLLGAATQLQDASIALLARLAGLAIAVTVFGTSIAGQVQHYGRHIFDIIVHSGG